MAELGAAWTIEDLVALARGNAKLEFSKAARDRVSRTRSFVDDLVRRGDSAPSVYGVNTGFGAMAETRVPAADLARLQHNLLRSHAAGVGPPLEDDVVRAMICLRAQVLSLGNSGVRPVVVDRLVRFHELGVIPRIPAQGSVGASGDLAPLAHLALVLIGEGEARMRDSSAQWRPAKLVLADAGIEPLALEAKEGLSLINGTQYMLAIGALACADAESLCRNADIIGAMSLEALLGTATPFDPRIESVRKHPGHAQSADNLRRALAGSELGASHVACGKVQDPYALRCMPQVHGATRDALRFVREVIERELVAATDNPLIFVHETGADVLSGGNFHGQPLALALDFAAIAVAELANISERRVEQLVNPAMSSGLPAFLAQQSGLDSGFMMAQVTAAALVSENKVLCHPASVDSIPSSAGKEDHVSMGSISARKLAQVVTNVGHVLGIEALVAAQGIDLRGGLRAGKGVAAAHGRLRESVPTLEHDRVLYPDIAAATSLVTSGGLVDAAAFAAGAIV